MHARPDSEQPAWGGLPLGRHRDRRGVTVRLSLHAAALALGLAWIAPARADAAPKRRDTPTEPTWCAPELEVLPGEVCHFAPARADGAIPDRLVIYLHGVIKPDTQWQWAQQRGMLRHASVHGLSVLVPRGRRGIGPRGMRDWWAWPTSASAQSKVEADLIREWLEAKRVLQQRAGRTFTKTYVFGFSNGAYYAASLALRGKLPVDGYALLAGGSAAYHRRQAARSQRRPPIYVGYGLRDRVGRDARELGAALRSLGWPYKLVGRPRVGHTIADSQVREALDFFGAP